MGGESFGPAEASLAKLRQSLPFIIIHHSDIAVLYQFRRVDCADQVPSPSMDFEEGLKNALAGATVRLNAPRPDPPSRRRP
jgi:hypothetical protein